MRKLTFGSLFAGIGGFDLGLERAGLECKWQVEIDDYATRVLEKHWPDVPRWRDVHDFVADASTDGQPRDSQQNGSSSEPKQQTSRRRDDARCGGLGVDLICGGFPCQPVSLAGNRKGDADERWLWDAFREVVSILRPRFVLVENVRGLLSAKDTMGRRGALFGRVLRDLAELGYDAEWDLLPAAAFDLPHLRERVFVIASNPNQPRPQERQGEPSNSRPQLTTIERTDWRAVEPTICRSGPRLPNRVDRLRGLGNAVVPQVAEWIGRQLIKAREKAAEEERDE